MTFEWFLIRFRFDIELDLLIGRPSGRLAKKAQNLLAQLCIQYPTEGTIFELSARLLEKEPLQKAQKLQKAHRAYTQVKIPNIEYAHRFLILIIISIDLQGQNLWTKTPEDTKKVLKLCTELCETSLKAYEELGGSSNAAAASQLSSARLTAQGCIKAAKDSDWQDQCSDEIAMLTDILESIKSKLLNKA